MRVSQIGVITLLKSAITGEKLTLPDGFSLGEALPLLKKHGIQAMGYLGAANCGISKTDPIMQNLFQFYCRSAVISQRQIDELSHLFAVFDENEIDYMPVKGAVIKHIYPAHELRPMSDADILIRMEQYDRIRPIMESSGYVFEKESDHELHWVCPNLHIELHKSLVPAVNIDLFPYYQEGWDRAKRGQGRCYQMDIEDQFVFLVTHFTKHFRGGGIGCRHLVDLWVFQRKYPTMNQSYICKELNKLGLLEFYQNMLAVLSCWFDGGNWDEITDFISEFIFNSGIWGELKSHHLAENAMHIDKSGQVTKGKFRVFFKRVFPGITYTRYQYPILKKAPFLLPFIWIVRWGNIILHKPELMKQRFHMLGNSRNDEILTWERNMSYVGLRYRYDSNIKDI